MGKKAIKALGLGAFLLALLTGKTAGEARPVFVRRPATGEPNPLISKYFFGGGDTATPASYTPTGPTVTRKSAPAGLSAILSLLRRAEAGAKGYDAVWGGINLADQPPKPPTQLTIGQVLAWQASIDRRYQSEAVGGYQFIEITLRRIYRRAGLTLNSPFSPANQDRMAVVLMEDAGLNRYRAGSLTPSQFGDKLARVWAGLPVHTVQRGRSRTVRRGQSYYAGDNLNKATINPEAVLAAIRSI